MAVLKSIAHAKVRNRCDYPGFSEQKKVSHRRRGRREPDCLLFWLAALLHFRMSQQTIHPKVSLRSLVSSSPIDNLQYKRQRLGITQQADKEGPHLQVSFPPYNGYSYDSRELLAAKTHHALAIFPA